MFSSKMERRGKYTPRKIRKLTVGKNSGLIVELIDKVVDKEDKRYMNASYWWEQLVEMDKEGTGDGVTKGGQPTRDLLGSPTLSPLVYKNHKFQPTGLLLTPYVLFVYSCVYQFQQLAP